MTKSVAVIGGGASAALLLAHLSNRPSAKNLSVDVYDRTGRFGRGVAYSTRHDCHLLNVRAANMSAFAEDKDHFARWAGNRGYKPEDFVPRKLYGHYLSDVIAEAGGVFTISKITQDVVAVKKTDDGFLLTTENGKRHIYDLVVLASGNVRPLRPRLNGRIENYYDDPWSADFTALKKAETIALVGSGLTSVDMVLALHAEKYKGHILVFSRNALLPAPHVSPVAFPSFLAPAEENPSPLALLHTIKQKTKEAAGRNIPWQAVIDSLRVHTNTIWQKWGSEERRQFTKRLLTFWNVHRHRMAPEIAETVNAMQDSGQLKIIKAGVQLIEQGPVVKSTVGDFAVGAVINCLGYRYEEEGRAYDVSGRIGPANFGPLFETTAIPEIRAQAQALAEKLLP